ncbi:MAG: hypothetical protein IJX86_01015 [Lachnospiraceae bacterium]|nr:hypothetical protein [Lachnospiraceae bacterium]
MIERLKFGLTKEGKEASIYILENNNGMHVQVSDFVKNKTVPFSEVLRLQP